MYTLTPLISLSHLSLSLSLSLSMASHSLKPLHHNPLRRRHPTHHPPAPLSSSSPFLKPPSTTLSLSHSLPLTPHSLSPSSSSTAAAAATPSAATFDVLRRHLAAQNFREADEETRRLLIVLAGESAQARGYVFFSETQFICASDLNAIDALWREHSGERFGYSVQKKIWKKANRDFTSFFIKVGWMKKLDTEVEQYNYRAFPNEFIWELNDETPMGHLPLTNALRGTQLLSSILSHPAFEGESDGESEGEEEERDIGGAFNSKANLSKVFKTDYSF